MDNDTQWNWWLNALAGERGELTRGDPKSGCYRDRNRACMIWRDGDGKLFCETSSGFQPRTPDQIDEAFGFWSTNPISHEVYQAFRDTGRWPEDIDPPVATIGDNQASMEPHEAIQAEINDLLERYKGWLATLPNGIDDESSDAKANRYAIEIGALKKKAEDTHRSEKAPHLEAGKLVDASWKPVIASADDAKRAVLAPTLEYRQKRAEAERQAREAEIARQRAAQAEAKETGARPVPVAAPPKRATGLRTVKVTEITDLPALAAQIAALANPPPAFVDACRTIAAKWLADGITVNGAVQREEKRAA